MKNINNKITKFGKVIKDFAQKYFNLYQKETDSEELLTAESKFGEAAAEDFYNRFEGSVGEGLINVDGKYHEDIHYENLNIGDTLPGV